MKYTLFVFALLAILQAVVAQKEQINEEIDARIIDTGSKCIVPKLVAKLIYFKKYNFCPSYKPFGYELKILVKGNVKKYWYLVKTCSRKHNPYLPKKIFKCSVALALKKCRFIGLPKCVTRKSHFLARYKLLSACLIKVLKKCSGGAVSIYKD